MLKTIDKVSIILLNNRIRDYDNQTFSPSAYKRKVYSFFDKVMEKTNTFMDIRK